MTIKQLKMYQPISLPEAHLMAGHGSRPVKVCYPLHSGWVDQQVASGSVFAPQERRRAQVLVLSQTTKQIATAEPR